MISRPRFSKSAILRDLYGKKRGSAGWPAAAAAALIHVFSPRVIWRCLRHHWRYRCCYVSKSYTEFCSAPGSISFCHWRLALGCVCVLRLLESTCRSSCRWRTIMNEIELLDEVHSIDPGTEVSLSNDTETHSKCIHNSTLQSVGIVLCLHCCGDVRSSRSHS